MMFQRVLVANRGEIAVRIIRTLKRLGIHAIAVYSEADCKAPHVKLADEAHLLGPAPAVKSYLAADRLLEVASAARADAIHPGYGFLAEHAGFASLCRDRGLVFIGPSPEAVAAMGRKVESRALAAAAGVPVVPGSAGPVPDVQIAMCEADRIGYPIVLKASAGGGGYGMRVVSSAAELEAGFDAARREAERAFGDGALYLERFFDPAPRHVEVQVFGDKSGRVVHLLERDCSAQRRFQKVIEEAPSPAISEDLRQRLTSAAIAIARHIQYENAGTVEFLLDREGQFYFLEMNTRLQVEHPVTEEITGFDLVELQLRIAAGELLPATVPAVPNGWAIEARIYAEQPERGFLPSPGRITAFEAPDLPGIRIDAGVETGSTVSHHYDPLIAKVIAHGSNREEARQHLLAALGELRVEGVRTNIQFLRSLIGSNEFARAQVDTRFIQEHLSDLMARP